MQAQTKSSEAQISPDPNSWSILKVPYRLRQVNEKAYEPRIISVGPYYHGKEHLRMMEIIKERCLSRIIKDKRGLAKEFGRAMKGMEENVRKCYPESFDHIDSSAFVRMMILDGCFVIDLFQNKNSNEHFLGLNGIWDDVHYDLFLPENQLPFFVLSKLYGIINMSNAEQTDEFAHLACSHLSQLMPRPVISPEKFSRDIKHLLGLVYDCWIPHHRIVQGQGTLSKFIRCARVLVDAGIIIVKKDINVGKVEDGVATSLFDIDFTYDAKLEIPTLEIGDFTEPILRSFMAYEQFIPIGKPRYVCDYVKFMDNLINSGKDVQLLCHAGVIDNNLGNDEAVAQMFTKLCDSIYMSRDTFYYKEIYDKIDGHCQRKRNQWKAKLKQDYFNDPWAIINFFYGLVFLLVLTVVQTICSVLSYVQKS